MNAEDPRKIRAVCGPPEPAAELGGRPADVLVMIDGPSAGRIVLAPKGEARGGEYLIPVPVVPVVAFADLPAEASTAPLADRYRWAGDVNGYGWLLMRWAGRR